MSSLADRTEGLHVPWECMLMLCAGEQSHLESVCGAQDGELLAALLPALAAAHTGPTPGPPAGLAPGSPARSPASHAPEQGAEKKAGSASDHNTLGKSEANLCS